MNSWNARLGGLLAVQGALVAVAWWPRGDAERPLVPLVTFEADAVTAVDVSEPPGEDGETKSVRLERDGDGWVIASAGGYPALDDKVTQVLTTLADVQIRNPLATTATSHAALGVAAGDYAKKVTIAAGGAPLTVYIGSGSGKSANVRVDGSDDVFLARGFSSWSINARDRGYHDPVYVDADPAAFGAFSIRGPAVDLQLERLEGAWTMEGLAEDEALDPDKVEALLKKASTARIAALDPDGASEEARPGVSVSWSLTEEGESVSGGYRVTTAATDGKHRVRADGAAFAVWVSEHGVKGLLEASRASLLTDPPDPEE